MAKTDPAPHHDGPTAKAVMFPDDDVRVALSGAPLHTNEPVNKMKCEAGLVSEPIDSDSTVYEVLTSSFGECDAEWSEAASPLDALT